MESYSLLCTVCRHCVLLHCTVLTKHQDMSHPKQLPAELVTPVAPRLNAHIHNCVMWDFHRLTTTHGNKRKKERKTLAWMVKQTSHNLTLKYRQVMRKGKISKHISSSPPPEKKKKNH